MKTRPLRYVDLSELRQEFAYALSNETAGRPVYTMSIERLKSVLLARFPALTDGRLLDRVVSVFDADDDGHIDFVEFASGLARLVKRGEDGDKHMDFVFSLFDKNQDGVVELWEVIDLVETAHDDLVDLHKYAIQKTKSLDANGDGLVQDEEVVAAVSTDRVYRELLWSGLPPVLCRVDIPLMNRGDAAATTWLFRGDESRRRRGRDVDNPWRRVDAAAATWIIRGGKSTPRPRRG